MTDSPSEVLSPEVSPNPPTPVPFPVVRSAAVLAGAVAVLAGAVWAGLTYGLEQPLHARINLFAATVCGGAGLIGLWPVWSMSRRSRHGAATGFMAGILLRMILCGAVVLVAPYTGYAHAPALTMWVAGWYMVVLAVEVKLVSSFALTHSAPTEPGASATGPDL